MRIIYYGGVHHAALGVALAAAAAEAKPAHTVVERAGKAFAPRGGVEPADLVVVPADAPWAREVFDAHEAKSIPCAVVAGDAKAFGKDRRAKQLASVLGVTVAAFAFPKAEEPEAPDTPPAGGEGSEGGEGGATPPAE